MPLTLYCDSEDVRFVWSSFGMASRSDDRDASSSTAIVNDAIEKAVTDVNLYLFQTYTPAVIAQSTWVKWATAVLAAVALARRRGNPVPASLAADFDRYLENLKAIQTGVLALPGDDGLSAPRFDNTPCVSNLRVDSRFRASVRRVTETSSQTVQSPHRKQFPLRGWPWPYTAG